VDGLWGSQVLSFRVINIATGGIQALNPQVAVSLPYSTFDLSWDGKRVAVARQDLRGHVWLQRLRTGTF